MFTVYESNAMPLIVAREPGHAVEQIRKRRTPTSTIEAEGGRMARRLDDTDEGKQLRGRKSTDREA